MKTVIFYNDARDVVRWVITPDAASAATPQGLHRLTLDFEVADPTAWRVLDGALVERSDSAAAAMRALRQTRDVLLAASDWTQLPDARCDRAAWVAYRDALRDLPSQTSDPNNIVWPERPDQRRE